MAESSESKARQESFSRASEDSQTAADFIQDQLQLEADAREALPYAFDTCTQPLGPLRQILFACLTCNPPPPLPTDPYSGAAVCYSCSIACHGDHTLVELFNKRNFVCDCGTTRLPVDTPCTLRLDQSTGRKGEVRAEAPAPGNKYNQNFRNRFCGCAKEYDAYSEKGTMFQCLGLGTAETGGCGEDWWHPACVVGVTPDGPEDHQAPETMAAGDDDPPPPPGFPHEDDFEAFICYKCVEAYPWIKRYAGTDGFLPPILKRASPDTTALGLESTNQTEPKAISSESAPDPISSKKRRLDDSDGESTTSKRAKTEGANPSGSSHATGCRYARLPPPSTQIMSLFLADSFREHLCRCAECFPKLSDHRQLLEEEDSYEPPLSESGDDAAGGSSVGTASLLDRGERALSNVDRVRAIEGVMVYNHLKDKVKSFLQPFAETGQAVGAEDIKKYFEKLRGDAEAVKAAGAAAKGDGDGGDGDGRKEQSGY
ncbi:MAG: hypothetical protein M1838_004354 [Thelocarpon superellum]|nr:MAG: hypothetical protein M1838_004354 [Thelocarpon superellum]